MKKILITYIIFCFCLNLQGQLLPPERLSENTLITRIKAGDTIGDVTFGQFKTAVNTGVISDARLSNNVFKSSVGSVNSLTYNFNDAIITGTYTVGGSSFGANLNNPSGVFSEAYPYGLLEVYTAASVIEQRYTSDYVGEVFTRIKFSGVPWSAWVRNIMQSSPINSNYLQKYTGYGRVAQSSIFDNGFVGIGTSSPLEKLHVSGNIKVDNEIYSYSTTSNYMRNYVNSTTGWLRSNVGDGVNSGYMEFYAPNQSRVAYFGYATNTGAIQFSSDNGGGIDFSGGRMSLGNQKIINLANAVTSTDAINLGQADGLYLGINATALNSITLSGQLPSYYLNCANLTGTLSDSRLSTNIFKASVGSINSVTYDFNDATTMGTYTVGGSSFGANLNNPSSVFPEAYPYGLLEVYTAASVIEQRYTSDYVGEVFTRTKFSGASWSAWVRNIMQSSPINSNYLQKYTGYGRVAQSSIFDNGFVGIGTSSPLEKLHVSGNIKVDNEIYSYSTTSNYMRNYVNSTTGWLRSNVGDGVNSGYMEFYAPNNARIGLIGYANTANGLQYNSDGYGHKFNGGNINVSNYLIRNLANAVSSTDAINLGQADGLYLGVSATSVNAAALNGQPAAYYNSWANLTGIPTTFAPSAHNHDASNITAGVLDDARLSSNIPKLNINNSFTGNIAIGTTAATSALRIYKAAGDVDVKFGTGLNTSSIVSNSLTIGTSAGTVMYIDDVGVDMNSKSIYGLPMGRSGSEAISVAQADNSYEKKLLSGSVTINTSIAAGNSYTTSITVSGAAVGDLCIHEFQTDDIDTVIHTKAKVIAANTVQIWVANAASSGTWSFNNAFKVKVFK